jgi:hypothetical protein
MWAAVSVAAITCVASCAFWARSYLRVDSVDFGDMQHSVVLASKAGSLYVWQSKTATWTFRPFNWSVYFHSMPRGRDLLSVYYVGSGERFDTMQTRLGFGWKRAGVNRLLKIPHWFLVLISSGLIVLWGYRRRCRFSIRALLFVTILLAGAVGLAVTTD